MLKKRSQITVFIVIALIIVILAIGALFLIRKAKTVTEESSLETKTELDNYVTSCIGQAADPLIKSIAEKGGTFKDTEALDYLGKKYTYLCTYSEGIGCFNKFITRVSMEQELNSLILDELKECKLEIFRNQGFKVTEGDKLVETSIGTDTVSVVLKFPVTTEKSGEVSKYDKFTYTSKYKLGKLYDLANTILNSEIMNNTFDEATWLRKYSEITIIKHKPYPDVTYVLNIDGTDVLQNLTFVFAVQGKDKAQDVNNYLQEDKPAGVCFLERDSNCYYNMDKSLCYGQWAELDANNFDCKGLSNFTSRNLREELPCGGHKSGDSWCEYDGITGPGFDPVGSRHYKKSCFDGVIYNTECTDYREELCTEPEPNRAICRPNRWQDCTEQVSSGDCGNKKMRDCYWVDYLVKSEPWRTVDYDYSKRKCIPYVPPGFRFWERKGEEVCRLANEQYDCADIHCPLTWVESTAMYCYFMGDCGNYFNYRLDFTAGSWSNSDGKPRPYIYTIPMKYNYPDEFPYALRLAYETGQKLDGNEFTFMQGSELYMDKKEKDWKKRMDSSEHVSFSIIPPKVDVDLDSIHSSYCHVWKAPSDASGCTDCNSDPEKPCSEYRCKSISPSCSYNKITTKCGFDITAKKPELNIQVERLYLLKGNATPRDAVAVYDSPKLNRYLENTLNLQSASYDAEWPRGYEAPDLMPYSKLLLVLKSNTPMNCKMTDAPFLDFATSGFESENFSSKVPIFIDAKSLQQEEEDSFANSFMADPLQKLNLGTTMDSSISDAQDAMGKLGGDASKGDDEAKKQGKQWTMGAQYSGLQDAFTQTTSLYNKDLRSFADDYTKTITDITVAHAANRAYHFIECQDATGELKKKVFLTYSLTEDTAAPMLVNSKPAAGSDIKTGDEITIGLNEPSECRFDFNSQDFSNMKYNFDCDRTDDYGIYYCRADSKFEQGSMDIRCKDQPSMTQIYYLNLFLGESNNISGPLTLGSNSSYVIDYAGMTLDGSDLTATYPDALKDQEKKITVSSESMNLHLEFPRENVCKITKEHKEFDDINESMRCNWKEKKYVCDSSANIDPNLGSASYRILCQKGIITQRNEASFGLYYR